MFSYSTFKRVLVKIETVLVAGLMTIIKWVAATVKGGIVTRPFAINVVIVDVVVRKV